MSMCEPTVGGEASEWGNLESQNTLSGHKAPESQMYDCQNPPRLEIKGGGGEIFNDPNMSKILESIH
jgi:hypothetical protein